MENVVKYVFIKTHPTTGNLAQLNTGKLILNNVNYISMYIVKNMTKKKKEINKCTLTTIILDYYLQ